MKPRERVLAALAHREADRESRFEISIDALLDELGQADAPATYANLGQDGIFLPTRTPPGSNAWREGVDEWAVCGRRACTSRALSRPRPICAAIARQQAMPPSCSTQMQRGAGARKLP